MSKLEFLSPAFFYLYMTISKLSKEDVLEYAARLRRLKYAEPKAMADIIARIANDEAQWRKWDHLASPRALQKFFGCLLDPMIDVLSSLPPEAINLAKTKELFDMEKEFRAQQDYFKAINMSLSPDIFLRTYPEFTQ